MTTFPGKPAITREAALEALQRAVAQVERNLPEFTDKCQYHSSVNNFYPTCENDDWTTGFFPGEIWLSYEHTGNEAFANAGLVHVQSFLQRIENKVMVDHHDMGFLYTPSCVAPYKLLGNEDARKAALLAADQLLARFHEKGEFLQAWGDMGAADNYRYIIDCLLNLPLLYWAYEQTGEEKYRDIARRHAATCLTYSMREDGSTFHTVFMDPETGAMVKGRTAQGYSDDSSWARGQAWAIYGIALSYRYDPQPRYLEAFRKCLEYYLTRLPEDLVPYWDMIFTDGDDEPRDSSSASITACGLLEMAGLVEGESPEEAARYRTLAAQMMQNMVEGYSVKDPAVSNGQVLHGTYCNKSPYNTCEPAGVDECVSWGDFFYMEALTRLTTDWKTYW